jgi:Protein of unknown function (DUF3999)
MATSRSGGAAVNILYAKRKRLAWHTWLFCLFTAIAAFISIARPEACAQSEAPSNKIKLNEWEKWRNIISSGEQSSVGYALVELDLKVFDHSNENLSDLRVVDQDGITSPYLILETEPNARLSRLPVSIVDQGVIGETSHWILDLGYRNIPTSRIEFQPAINNFHRQFEIARSNDRNNWFPVGDGEIIDVKIGGLKREQLFLNYDEIHARYLRIRVFNRDDQPFKLAEARVFGHPRRLLFRVDQGKSYRLFYGNQKETAPRYDLEQLLPYVKIYMLPVMNLDEEQDRPEAASQIIDQGEAKGHPAWLWVTLVVAALVIAVLIYRLARMTVV